MRDAHELVLLRLQRILEGRLCDRVPEVRTDFVDMCAVRAKASVLEVRTHSARLHVPGSACSPFSKAVAEVAAVEKQCGFTGFYEVGGDLVEKGGE